MKTRTTIALLLTLLAAAPVFAVDPLRPMRATTPPIIDGRLDEQIWQQAPSVTGFKTWMPDYGVMMANQTIAWFAYDRLTVYAMGTDISTHFAADAGYLTRSGVTMFEGAFVPRFYPKNRVVQRVELSGTVGRTRDAFSGIWEGVNQGSVTLRMRRAATLNVNYHSSTEVFLAGKFPTSGFGATASIQLVKQLRLQGSAGRGNAIYYSSTPFGGQSTRASATIVYQPSEQWYQALAITYANFDRTTDGTRLYDYAIARSKTSFQVNRFLFFRGILEYNSFKRQLVTDFLGSFTYIPGTVLHAGYGSLYEKMAWDGTRYVPDRSFAETRRGVFFKASYLWRL